MSAEFGQGRNLLFIALAIWLATAAVLGLSLPLFPIDENRVLTVAWEMRESADWLLPTLNFAPYAHKPPLLFWLINAAWTVFGTSVGAVRGLMAMITAGVIVMTYQLGRELFPDRSLIAGLAALLMLAAPPIAIHGAMVMYDLLLSLCILMGWIALWRGTRTTAFWPWVLYGLAIGLGVLAKGPVVLVFLLGPALFVKMWTPNPAIALGGWFLRVLAGVLIGAGVALAWAVPAAITGGPAYAELIFWKQSADRVAGTMHHRRPFWYYVPVVIGFVSPFFLWPPAWRALKASRQEAMAPPVRFLIACIVPALIFMSATGGKQVHYILPVVPPLALLGAWGLSRVKATSEEWLWTLAPYALGFAGLAALPAILHRTQMQDAAADELWSRLSGINPLWYLGGAALSLVLSFALRGSLTRQAAAMAASSVLVLNSLALQFPNNLDRLYNLEGLAAALHPYEKAPIGFAGRYLGEIGYPARLRRKVEVVPERGVEKWLAGHPEGVVVVHDLTPREAEKFDVLYAQPYGLNQSLHLVHKKNASILSPQ
jgi:4-amino-4-deoxy-L-arabinose transferase-like glycosyltransferase